MITSITAQLARRTAISEAMKTNIELQQVMLRIDEAMRKPRFSLEVDNLTKDTEEALMALDFNIETKGKKLLVSWLQPNTIVL